MISGSSDPSGWRLPAPAFEQTVTDIIKDHSTNAATSHTVQILPDAGSLESIKDSVTAYVWRLGEGEVDGTFLRTILKSGAISRSEIKLSLNLPELAKCLKLKPDEINPAPFEITAPFQIKRRGIETKIIAGETTRVADPKLNSILNLAHGWCQELESGTKFTTISERENTSESYLRTRSKLAFLSPKIQTAILDGTQPVDLSLETIIRQGIPLSWEDQEQQLGFLVS